MVRYKSKSINSTDQCHSQSSFNKTSALEGVTVFWNISNLMLHECNMRSSYAPNTNKIVHCLGWLPLFIIKQMRRK